MDNIRYGKLDATDEEVYEAARLAHADQFIKMLPKGYDTMLSGDGEETFHRDRDSFFPLREQQLQIPPVLILDEATSSIDTRTESIVQKGMDKPDERTYSICYRAQTFYDSQQ